MISDVKPDFLISNDFCRDFPWFLGKRTRFPKVSYPLKSTYKNCEFKNEVGINHYYNKLIF